MCLYCLLLALLVVVNSLFICLLIIGAALITAAAKKYELTVGFGELVESLRPFTDVKHTKKQKKIFELLVTKLIAFEVALPEELVSCDRASELKEVLTNVDSHGIHAEFIALICARVSIICKQNQHITPGETNTITRYMLLCIFIISLTPAVSGETFNLWISGKAVPFVKDLYFRLLHNPGSL